MDPGFPSIPFTTTRRSAPVVRLVEKPDDLSEVEESDGLSEVEET